LSGRVDVIDLHRRPTEPGGQFGQRAGLDGLIDVDSEQQLVVADSGSGEVYGLGDRWLRAAEVEP